VTASPTTIEAAPSILVLGIGNVLWADEGFGVRCIERLHDEWELGDVVRVMDGGTQGLYLVPYVTESAQVLVFDAVDFRDPPGTLRVVRGDDVPQAMGAHNVSLHQVGFQDVLAAAALLGKSPSAITLIGVQPEMLEDYGGGLTPTVAARLGDALALGLAELALWGARPARRVTPAVPLMAPSIQRSVYEGGRPSAEDACRIGDARFMPRTGGE
jgi:hydrogenase maturation protease